MAHLWSPDTCRGGVCTLEIVDGHKALVRVVKTCQHHAAIRARLGDDAAFFNAVLETNRAKNYGTYEVAKELDPTRANELHGSIQWRIDDQDRVIIPIFDSTRRAAYQAKVDARVGAGKVVIEDATAPRPVR